MKAGGGIQERLSSVVAKLHAWPLARVPRRLNELIPHRAKQLEPRTSAYAVYRARNEGHVLRLIRQLPDGAQVHLHALDSSVPTLAERTRTAGSGSRMSLLQGLIDAHPPQEDGYVLIFDDDVLFRHSTAADFVGLAAGAGFDFAQPAHGVKSTRSFGFNRVAWLSTARHSLMVEIGPVLLISPRAQQLVLPFPEDSGMGWGLDVRWAGLRAAGLEFGVVDATPIRHLGTIASEYAFDGELEYLDAALREQGLSSVYELDKPLKGPVWRPWQTSPPWLP